MSIDGYIADENGGIDWLPMPEDGEDYGYADFISNIGKNLSRSVANPSYDVRAFASAFMEAVDAKAFTRPDFEGPGGASPVYATSLLLTSASYAVELFDAKSVWRDGERQRG